MKFQLNISIGNAGMQTSYDLACALRTLAYCIEKGDYVRNAIEGVVSLPFRDDNGNRVGQCTLTDDQRTC